MSEQLVQIEIVDKRNHDLADLQREAQSILADVGVEGTVANMRAKNAGLDLELLKAASDKHLKFKPAGAGITGVDVVLVLLSKIGYDLWKKVLLPHILEKWGAKAIKAREASASPPAKTEKPKAAPKDKRPK